MVAGIVALLLGCGAPSPANPAENPISAQADGEVGARRIVAVGDLHGDLDNALAVLRMAGIVNAEGTWSGGRAILVQTGDVADRGADTRAVFDLLRRLSTEAEAAGGQVVAMLGNHEAMNLTGDWRYVHPADVAAYGGVQARRDALSAAGPDGVWLRTLPSVVLIERTVFAHGGVTPEAASLGAQALNDAVRAGLEGSTAAVPALGPAGPLWYRGYAEDPEDSACPRLAVALAQLGARRMVVGHTPRLDGRVQTRCNGALVVIDIGISDAYGGHLGALELRGDDAWAIYPDEVLDLPDP